MALNSKFVRLILLGLLLSCGKDSGLPIGAGGSAGVDDDGILTIFKTAATHSANFAAGYANGIAGADAFCASQARALGYSGTYKALMAMTTFRRACSLPDCSANTSENVDWVLKPNTEYFRASDQASIGVTNAAGVFNLAGGSLSNTFDDSFDFYWTGIYFDWRSDNRNCANWTDSTNASTGAFGYAQATDSDAIHATTTQCNNSYPILCAEQ